MRRTRDQYSPRARARAEENLKQLTRAIVLVSTAAAAFIGVTLAREHPGSSASANTPRTTVPPAKAPAANTPASTVPPTTAPPAAPTQAVPTTPATSPPPAPTTTTAPPAPTTTAPPTTTTTRPVVTSGGTSRL
jgi:hypothetical protein